MTNMVGSMAACTQAGNALELQLRAHILTHKQEAEQGGRGTSLWQPQACSQRQIYKTTAPNPFQTVPSTGAQLFKLELLELFSYKPPSLPPNVESASYSKHPGILTAATVPHPLPACFVYFSHWPVSPFVSSQAPHRAMSTVERCLTLHSIW